MLRSKKKPPQVYHQHCTEYHTQTVRFISTSHIICLIYMKKRRRGKGKCSTAFCFTFISYFLMKIDAKLVRVNVFFRAKKRTTTTTKYMQLYKNIIIKRETAISLSIHDCLVGLVKLLIIFNLFIVFFPSSFSNSLLALKGYASNICIALAISITRTLTYCPAGLCVRKCAFIEIDHFLKTHVCGCVVVLSACGSHKSIKGFALKTKVHAT